MKVRFKKIHPNAVTPSYAKPGDAGLDLTATEIEETPDFIEYKLGVALEIPDGYVGIMVPRSSVTKKTLMMKNSIGVIDSTYRGELVIRFKRLKETQLTLWGEAIQPQQKIYDIGDRVAQIIILPYPQIELEQVEELSTSVRGEQGFGSTGN